jgi:hypothetical protein
MIDTLMNQNKNRVNYRFPLWLTVIFLLLILVPCAILTNQIILAKLSGLLCLLIVIVALRFWFRAAKLNSNVRDRVIINRNDWFDLERKYPSLYKWNKMDVSILKDRIGLLLANVEMRQDKEMLCGRNEAVEMAFQFCVYYWGEDYPIMENAYLYIGAENQISLLNRENEELLQQWRLGFSQPSESIQALKAHYRLNN